MMIERGFRHASFGEVVECGVQNRTVLNITEALPILWYSFYLAFYNMIGAPSGPCPASPAHKTSVLTPTNCPH